MRAPAYVGWIEHKGDVHDYEADVLAIAPDVAVFMLAALVGNRATGAVHVSDIQRTAMLREAAALADALLEHLEKTAPGEDAA